MLSIVTGLIYFILAVAFLTSGLLLIMKLKNHFGQFYQEIKTPIWIATLTLCFNLLVRSTLDAVRFFDKQGLD
jgi:hypothetical protein